MLSAQDSGRGPAVLLDMISGVSDDASLFLSLTVYRCHQHDISFPETEDFPGPLSVISSLHILIKLLQSCTIGGSASHPYVRGLLQAAHIPARSGRSHKKDQDVILVNPGIIGANGNTLTIDSPVFFCFFCFVFIFYFFF